MAITRTRGDDGVATITMDDGKANAFDLEAFDALDAAFDDCADDAAIVLAGREGMFSGGLNTKVLAALDLRGLTELLVRFGQTMHRIWLEPRPVVAAATGHAIAGGTILAMCCDHAVAARGPFKWGLTETTIGFPMPSWIIAIARGNVRADRLDDLVLPGALVTPDEAVDCGFADALADPADVLTAAVTRAQALAQLPRGAYAATKRQLRGAASHAAVAAMRPDIEAALAAR